HAERAQQDRRMELAAAIDPDEQDVARVELEIDPRAAVRDDARGIQKLSRGMRLALVVVKKDAGRTMESRHDEPLRAGHHESTVHGHQGDLAEVNLLLLDVLDRPYVRLRVDVPDDELNRDLQRRRIGHATLMTLLDVVLRRAKRVTDELERCGFVEVLDREN